MTTRDFAKHAQNPDFYVELFYDPVAKLMRHASQSFNEKSLALRGHLEEHKGPKIGSYQVDPSAKKINKEHGVIPADELSHMVKALTAYDPQGYSNLALTETNVGERAYYVSLDEQKASQIPLTLENVADAVRLIKQKESLKALVQDDKAVQPLSAQQGPSPSNP